MIIDTLDNAHRYYGVHAGLRAAFRYLQETDIAGINLGKHIIDGDSLFAIVQEYETLDSAREQMESHRKYIDVQYMIQGEELIGHALYKDHAVAKEYSHDEDYVLYADSPEFYSKLTAGVFMVFFSTDLHMPCIKVADPVRVKKIVVKVAVA